MMIDTKTLVPMTEASQDFSKIVQMVDEAGMAVILQNNKPRYMVLNFAEYDEIQAMRKKFIGGITDALIDENIDALTEHLT
jgi:antitoxin Phd